MVDIAEQQAAGRLVNDQANVAADTYRPEVRVLGTLELVKAHAATGRIHLQVKGGGLGSFLFVAGKPGEAGSESVGNPEVHRATTGPCRYSCPASSTNRSRQSATWARS